MLITSHNPHRVYSTMGVNTANANISHWLSNAFCIKWGLPPLEVCSDIIYSSLLMFDDWRHRWLIQINLIKTLKHHTQTPGCIVWVYSVGTAPMFFYLNFLTLEFIVINGEANRKGQCRSKQPQKQPAPQSTTKICSAASVVERGPSNCHFRMNPLVTSRLYYVCIFALCFTQLRCDNMSQRKEFCSYCQDVSSIIREYFNRVICCVKHNTRVFQSGSACILYFCCRNWSTEGRARTNCDIEGFLDARQDKSKYIRIHCFDP